MTGTFDVAVLGGGPAGMAAATTTARRGAATVLIDENAAPGGQVYRAPAPGFAPPDSPDRRAGDALRSALAGSGAVTMPGARVWGLGGGPLADGGDAEPFRIDLLCAGRVETRLARALILCAGTHERVIPFAGWTLPGVIGLAAATVLLKAEGVLPGRRVVVAGTGPLLAAVAAGILKLGGSVAAVIDAAPRRDWLQALPALASRPALLARGLVWLAAIRRAGVPMLSGWRLAAAFGGDEVAAVEAVPTGGGPARRIACDAVCVGHGLVPATEASRLFGAAHAFVATRGGWVPLLDAWQRSSVPRLFAAGDCAGIAGAAAAPHTGEIAALAALHDLGRLDPIRATAAAAAPRRALAAARRFGGAMAALMTPSPALVAAIPADCTVCRCEDVTRAEIEAAVAAGARDLNQLKQFTRCGMGPCQGRMCGEAAAELLAARVGGRDAAGCYTARLPLRPVPMQALLGDFDYADIPIPAPAPP
jgi:NADPH-dependent 2,4-dienoyl-CoA reductase/sulfur reductase-like enzyme